MKNLIIKLLVVGIPCVLFIFLWTGLTSWQHDITCQVTSVQKVMVKTYELVTPCQCVGSCHYVSCNDLIREQSTGPCCLKSGCSFRERQFCSVESIHKIQVTLEMISPQHQTTKTSMILPIDQVKSNYMDEPWPCHYERSWVNYQQTTLSPNQSDNKIWYIVLASFFSIIIIPIWFCAVIDCCETIQKTMRRRLINKPIHKPINKPIHKPINKPINKPTDVSETSQISEVSQTSQISEVSQTSQISDGSTSSQIRIVIAGSE